MDVITSSPSNVGRFLANFYRRIINFVEREEGGATNREVLHLLLLASEYLAGSMVALNSDDVFATDALVKLERLGELYHREEERRWH